MFRNNSLLILFVYQEIIILFTKTLEKEKTNPETEDSDFKKFLGCQSREVKI